MGTLIKLLETLTTSKETLIKLRETKILCLETIILLLAQEISYLEKTIKFLILKTMRNKKIMNGFKTFNHQWIKNTTQYQIRWSKLLKEWEIKFLRNSNTSLVNKWRSSLMKNFIIKQNWIPLTLINWKKWDQEITECEIKLIPS